eukprot:COSAG03_NODE_1787_length_3522_cov_7.939819_2_plen_77_part_00
MKRTSQMARPHGTDARSFCPNLSGRCSLRHSRFSITANLNSEVSDTSCSMHDHSFGLGSSFLSSRLPVLKRAPLSA